MTLAITIRQTKNKGRGVFATRDFNKGEVIEECPVVPIAEEDCKKVETTPLDNYFYAWRTEKEGALVLGYGWIYNHSYRPNAIYERNFEKRAMVYRAIRPIKSGDEICVNYNGEPENMDPIDWIDIKE